MRRNRQQQFSPSGYSILELLISVAVMSIVVGGIFALTTQNQMFGRNATEASETVQNARAAFELMSREIQGAGLGYPANQAFVAASETSLTIRGTFPKIKAVATTIDSASGVLTISPITNFAVGQRVLLVNANSTAAAYTTITAIEAEKNQITVATTVGTDTTEMWAIPATASTTIASFGTGTSVMVVQCVTYSISTTGTLKRSVAPERGAAATEESDLAKYILTADGAQGLNFKYYDSSGTEVTNPGSAASLATLSLVNLKLTTRNRNPSYFSKQYETVQLVTEIRPRG